MIPSPCQLLPPFPYLEKGRGRRYISLVGIWDAVYTKINDDTRGLRQMILREMGLPPEAGVGGAGGGGGGREQEGVDGERDHPLLWVTRRSGSLQGRHRPVDKGVDEVFSESASHGGCLPIGQLSGSGPLIRPVTDCGWPVCRCGPLIACLIQSCGTCWTGPDRTSGG